MGRINLQLTPENVLGRFFYFTDAATSWESLLWKHPYKGIIIGGEYSSITYARYPIAFSVNDGAIEVEFTLDKNLYFDIKLGARVETDTNYGYYAGLQGNLNIASGETRVPLIRLIIWRCDTDGWNILAQKRIDALDITKKHQIKFSIYGTTLKLYFDGIEELSATDDMYSSGHLALAGLNYWINRLKLEKDGDILYDTDFTDANPNTTALICYRSVSYTHLTLPTKA